MTALELRLSRAWNGPDLTVTIDQTVRGDAETVRDALIGEADALYEGLTRSLPRTTLRALTALLVAGLAARLNTAADRGPGRGCEVGADGAGFALVDGPDGPQIDTIPPDLGTDVP